MGDVRQRLDQEEREKEAAQREPNLWKEVVEDIWEECLPHFRGAVYTGDGLLLYDAGEGYYLFQKEDGNEEDDDLMGGREEEEEEREEREEREKEEREKEREEEGEEDEFSVISEEGMYVEWFTNLYL